MLNEWELWAYRPPHQLEGTEPLPKFKRMPSSAKIRMLFSHELNALRPRYPLAGMLADEEDLEPILRGRGRRQSTLEDIWNGVTAAMPVEELLDGAFEKAQRDEAAVVTSNLAQAAAQMLPLMVLDGQLYYQTGTIWTPMGRDELILAYEEDPRVKAALQGLSMRGLADLYARVKLQPSIQRSLNDVRMPPELIPCRDGVFDLDTMCSRHVRPDDYFFSYCNIGVDEIGMGSGEWFERFVESVSNGDPAIRQQILELVGVIISGYRPKAFFLLLGPRDTGKSQLLNLLRDLVGDHCTQSISDPNELSGPWMSGSLVGKRLCYCPDAARVPLSQKSAAVLKQLTGGDLLQANVKYKQPFTFRNETSIIFVSNYSLSMPRDEALESRLVTIPFNNSVPKTEQISNFSSLLYGERGYIVREAVYALKALIKRNFVFTRAEGTQPGLREAYPGGTIRDELMRFVEERCMLDPDGQESVDALYTTFCDFQSGVSCSREAFSRELNGLFQELKPFRTAKQRGYRGIRLIR